MYKIMIYPNTLAPWFSQVYAGLYELRRSGKARMSLSTELKHSELFDGTSLALEVTELSSGKKRSILVDLNDNRHFSIPQAIEWFDVIVKRSFYPGTVSKLPSYLRNKIVPYGINFNCGSPTVPILQLFVAHHLMRFRLLGRPKSKKHGFEWRHQLRFLLYMTKNDFSFYESDFEGHPHAPTKYRVFFISRLFDLGKGLTDFSRERIELVKALKKEFGPRFHGGIVKNRLSERYCPRDLLYAKVSRRQFTKTLKESDIVVSTLGVGESNPWKLGEAIAGARCIVSEPLRFELPAPLEEGVHIRKFVTADDCLRTCEELIRNPESIRQMKENVWGYYQQHVKAEKLMARILAKAFYD